jgi:hypothetical protein
MKVLRSALVALLFVIAVSGWAVAGNLILRTLPLTNAPDSTLTGQAAAYAAGSVTAEASGNYQALEPLTAADSPARANLKAIEVAKPDPISDLALVGPVQPPAMLWRAGDTALVQVEYSVTSAGAVSNIAEHYMLRLSDGSWLVWGVWRIDPGTPLIPTSSSAPGPSAAPTPTPGPSETIPPFETAPPAPSDEPLPTDSPAPAASESPVLSASPLASPTP